MSTIFDAVVSAGLPDAGSFHRTDGRPERPDPVDTREALTRATIMVINPKTDGLTVANGLGVEAEIQIPPGTQNVSIFVTTDDAGGVSTFQVYSHYEQGSPVNHLLKDYTNPTMDATNFVTIVGSTDTLPYLYVVYTNASGVNKTIGVWVAYTSNT